MAKTKTQGKGMSTGSKVAIGATIAAAAVGAYLLFGPEGKKNRKKVTGWAVKMKGEIIEKFEQAKDLTEPVYHKIVDEVTSRYAKMKNVDQAELKAMVADMRKHWGAMSKGAKPKTRAKSRTASKSKRTSRR